MWILVKTLKLYCTLRRASEEMYTCSAVSTTGASVGGGYKVHK